MTEEQEKYETSLIVNDRRSASIEPVAQYSESGNMVLVAVQKGYDPALIDWRIALCVFGMMWGNTDYKAK